MKCSFCCCCSCHLACLPINSSLLRCQHCGWHLWMLLLLPSLIPLPLCPAAALLDHAGHLTSAACCHSALRDLPTVCFEFPFPVWVRYPALSSPLTLTCLHLRLIDANFRRHYCKFWEISRKYNCIPHRLMHRYDAALYVGLCTHSILTQLPYKYAYDKYLGQPLQNARLSLTISNWQRNLSFILTAYGSYS